MSAPSAPLDLRVVPGAVDGVAARCVHGLLVCGAATSLAAVALAMVLAGLIWSPSPGRYHPQSRR
jgi:hypothetical protein